MIDQEVARLRRLRVEALRVREVARALGSARWANDDAFFSRGAGAGWRIARVASGKLKAHPYLQYQRGVAVGALVRNRVVAMLIAMIAKNRLQGLRAYEAELLVLMKQLEDARALTWSTEFSDTLGRSLAEVRALMTDIAMETKSEIPAARQPAQPARTDSLVGELAKTIEGDWPYLAF
jgi:hypothetical protein